MKSAVSLLFLAVVSGAMGTAQAQSRSSYRLSTAVERIENPLLADQSPGGATVLRIAPSYVYEDQGDRTRMRFSAGASIERSSNTDLVANREFPNVAYSLGYSWPTSTLEVRTSLAETSTRNTEFRDLGRVSIDTREQAVEAGARWDQELTERIRLALDLSSGRSRFDSALFEDRREQAASGTLTWEVSERAVYFLEASRQRLLPSGASPDSSQSRWLVGARGDFSPSWSLSAAAGQARSSGVRRLSGAVAQLRLGYRGIRTSGEIELSRDQTASASDTAYVPTRAIGLRLGYRLGEGSTLQFSLAGSRSEGTTADRGNTVNIRWENELSPVWTATLGYEVRESRTGSGTSGRGNAVSAALVYAYPGR